MESNYPFFQKHPSLYLLFADMLDHRGMKAALGLVNTHWCKFVSVLHGHTQVI